MDTAPKSLQIRYSARTERLVEALLSDLQPPLPEPTWRECIVVPGRGMARWLELELGARLGVWANPWFPFPESFVRHLGRQLRPAAGAGAEQDDLLEPERLRWLVAALLPDRLHLPAFKPLADWLDPGGGRDAGRLMSLSARIAEVYDHYLLHRPDLLSGWEAGEGAGPPRLPDELADLPGAAEDAAWQGPLWRDVAARARGDVGGGDAPGTGRFDQIVARLDEGRLPAGGREPLRRVSVFGLSTLSPAYLRVLAALGRRIPVVVYSLAPSPADARRMAKLAAGAGWAAEPGRLPPAAEAREALAAMGGSHSLLEGQGEAARGFQVLAGIVGAAAADLDGPPRDRGGSLLARLQAGIAAGGPETGRAGALAEALAGRDRSIGLHSCHGPLREAEVLRDQLLAAFDELPDLAPHEVVIACPELERYAPYLEAVLGLGGAEGRAIPYQVVDGGARAAGEAGEAFRRALGLLGGRMGAPEVLDLLAMPPVRDARGLDDAAVGRLWQAIEAVGIRWGRDADHRRSEGQPALEANTWRWGLTRMALGWAAPGDGRARFGGLLPFGEAAADGASLGALAELVACLGRWRDRLLPARLGLDAWRGLLAAFLADLLGEAAAGEEERLALELCLGRLAERAGAAGFREDLGLELVLPLLGEALAERLPDHAILDGGVTVCAPQTLRGVPCRVLALVGMNDGAFPRGDRPPGFDLAARRPLLGDTTRRDADRLLFLEALLCARDRLLITWTGQDTQSEGDLPPSVLVSELVESLRRMAGGRAPEAEAGEDGPAEEPGDAEGLVLRHALHPFSPRYFGAAADPRWFSYSAAYAGGGGRAPAEAPAFAPRPLAPPGLEPGETLRLDALARFLEAPAMTFVRDRLGILLQARARQLEAREPMTLDALERHWIGEAILRAMLAGADPLEAADLAAAEGRLPLGTPGRLLLDDLRLEAERLFEMSAPLRASGPAASLALDLDLGADLPRLTGSLDGLRPAGRVELGYGRLDGRRMLRLWVRHLALCAALEGGGPPGVPPVTWAIGRASGEDRGQARRVLVRLGPVIGPRPTLMALARLRQAARSEVLPFYPRAAEAYARTLEQAPAPAPGAEGDPQGRAAALAAAAEYFGAGRLEEEADAATRRRVDLDEPYLRLALGDHLPWDADGEPRDPAALARFERLASEVLAPLGGAVERWLDQDAHRRLAEIGG